ncbi:MAG: hypothetical protein J5764_05590, partial [Bacteroidales bacterium]|nr:hypothetical protein [Bacteroidales bacterium]
CSRQFKYVYRGHNIYTDQMPCFRVLNDGKTLFGFLESRNETKVPLDYNDKEYYASYCKVSAVYNDGLDWKDLGENSEGPSRRHTNVDKGAAGYVATFPSGEVVVGKTLKSDYVVKILNSYGELPAGTNWAKDWMKALPEPGYWGTLEADGPQTLFVAMHSDSSKGLQIARYWLNHRIDAEQGKVSDDAFYLGTDDGAETYIRVSRTADNLVLHCNSSPEVRSIEFRLCVPGGQKIVRNTISGRESELRIPLASLDNPAPGDYICVFAVLSSEIESRTFTAAKVSDPLTWQRIRMR